MATIQDIDPIFDIAKRYGIKIYLTDWFRTSEQKMLDAKKRGLEVDPIDVSMSARQRAAKGITDGPHGHWCSDELRTVWFDHLDKDGVKEHLHELCHVIIHPPDGIDSLSEDVALMPFERALAEAFLSPQAQKHIIRWQEVTLIEWWDAKAERYYNCLEEIPGGYLQHPNWKESVKALCLMRALRKTKGKLLPTFRYPDWSKAPKRLLERGNVEE